MVDRLGEQSLPATELVFSGIASLVEEMGYAAQWDADLPVVYPSLAIMTCWIGCPSRGFLDGYSALIDFQLRWWIARTDMSR